MRKKYINICIGPILFLMSLILLNKSFGIIASKAIGVLLWMVYWWITRPVNLTVTAGLPIVLNAIFDIVPMNSILSQYSSSSLVLIFGSGLLSLACNKVGLDRRIALKALSLIGPSMTSQIIVWFIASVTLSIFMPNVAVCALYCPIAIAMLNAAGYKDTSKSKQASYILIAIGWGAGIGGAGSPLGGAMNITAISYLQSFSNKEFMYIDWIIRITPYLVITTFVLLLLLIKMSEKCEPIKGTKEYFSKLQDHLPKINRDEIICGTLFILTVIGSFLRPLYANILPNLEPAYLFLTTGGMMFILSKKDKNTFIEWEEAEKESLWGMMLLFGGGIALGNIITNSGASYIIAELISNLNLDNNFLLMIIFGILAVLISELTNSTVCASVLIPIALTTAQNIGINPLFLWIAICIYMNAEFLLPISIRAIPASYGMDLNLMFKNGLIMSFARFCVATLYIIVCNNILTNFSIF